MEIITDHRQVLEDGVQLLLEKEKIEGKDLQAILRRAAS